VGAEAKRLNLDRHAIHLLVSGSVPTQRSSELVGLGQRLPIRSGRTPSRARAGRPRFDRLSVTAGPERCGARPDSAIRNRFARSAHAVASFPAGTHRCGREDRV